MEETTEGGAPLVVGGAQLVVDGDLVEVGGALVEVGGDLVEVLEAAVAAAALDQEVLLVSI